MEEPQFHPLDYVSVLRRRKWWFIIPCAVGLVIGVLLTIFLPREYQTAAEIGVAAPTLSPELLRSVGSLDQNERQRAISQQLLSRTVLERVVRDERINPERPIEEVVAWLRRRVQIDVPRPIGRNNERAGIDTFSLSFLDSTPERTQRIANRLAYVFAEENSRTTTERAQNTSEVLAQQLRGSQERLTEIEGRLRTKKEANMGRLPNQVDANLQMVNGLRQQHEAISMNLRGEQDRLSQVESQLESMRQGIGAGSVTSAGAAAVHSSQGRINQLSQELTQARALGYTDKHPEILRLQEEIRVARTEVSSAQKNVSGGELLQTDPLYRQKTAERDAINLRIAALRRAEMQTRSQIAQFQNRVEAAPMVEQDLASLTREHELEKLRYLDLSQKHQSAVMAEELARKQGGERFSVLYPAGLPSTPKTPDLLRLWLMTIAGSLVFGAGMIIVREFLDRSVYDTRALGQFEVPVLGEIPRITGHS